MAKNTNDARFNTNDSVVNLSRRLPLGEKGKFGAAIANEKSIREIAKMLQMDLKHIYYISSFMRKVVETLDIVLHWLEDTKDNVEDNTDEFQKKESVLRGLFHITELGSYTYLVRLLELVTEQFPDPPENPYKAKREHAKECLKHVEKQKQKVFELVEKACNLLQQITREPEFDQRKADEFNSTVRQANVFIKSCKSLLTEAENTINELIKINTIIKTFSRVVRFVGFGAICYALYDVYPSTSTVDSLAAYIPATGLTLMRGLVFNRGVKTVSFAASCAAASYVWLSLFPSKAYAFQNDLEELELKHERLTRALRGLEKRLKTVNENFS